MPSAVVRFDHVWKKFRRGERHDSLRDLIPSVLRSLVKNPAAALGLVGDQEFWAVKDVSFQVGAGEALGIIGPNGAGKSTILKLLTRILRPTGGSCSVHGRVGALIEVSAGFHPDLTGRENIYLQGAVMGMRRIEIAQKFDAIVEFSGLAEFVDTPIKRYSSGMNARLGFSIAAHLNPEVLIIDEVLAVGDAVFQQRCFERIRALKNSGVTLVFVSHNLAAIEALCDQTLVLWKGQGIFLGDPRRATQLYLHPPDDETPKGDRGSFERRGNRDVEITTVVLRGPGGQSVSRINSGSALELLVTVLGRAAEAKDVVLRFSVVDSGRIVLFGENGAVKARSVSLTAGAAARFSVRIDSLPLTEGRYYFTVAAHSPFTQDIYDWHEAAYSIDVVVPEDMTRVGRIGLSTSWTVEQHLELEADNPSLAGS